LIADGDELAAINRLRTALLAGPDPVLQELLGRLLVRVGKEVEGSRQIELAREELGAPEGHIEDLLREVEHLLGTEKDQADAGPDA